VSQIVEVVNLEVPVEAAYEQWADFESFPTFFTSVEEVTRIDATHHHWRMSVAGGGRQFDTVITEQLANDRIAWTSTAGEVDHGGVITFHKLSDSASRVAVQIDWEAEGFAEKVGAVLNVPDHALKTELGHFKDHVEAAASNSR
jgi:uncharacterized membrane protein